MLSCFHQGVMPLARDSGARGRHLAPTHLPLTEGHIEHRSDDVGLEALQSQRY
jgi:hypothetical protein